MKREQKWVVPRTSKVLDPRIAIARHLSWTKPISSETEYSLPEPDHYNYAGLAKQPWDCPIVQAQVFYWDRKLDGWWSVYYVPQELETEFIAWATDIPFDFCWTPFRLTKMRNRRTLLKTRASAVEQTADERLYTMGYYDELQKEFNIDLGKTLGTPRPNMPTGEFV